MRTVPTFTSAYAMPFFARVANVVAQRIEYVRRVIDGHRSAAELARMDEHALKDIGLTRSDVLRAVERPFTEDPTEDLQRTVRERRKSYAALHREAERDWL
jgi:uncharacterized protein YjiS (DUF1127 family)